MWVENEWERDSQLLELRGYRAVVAKHSAKRRPKGSPAWFWQVSRITHAPCYTSSILPGGTVDDCQGYAKTEARARRYAENRLRQSGVNI